MLERKQEEAVRNNKTTIEYMDKQLLLIGKVDPNKPSDYLDPKMPFIRVHKVDSRKKMPQVEIIR